MLSSSPLLERVVQAMTPRIERALMLIPLLLLLLLIQPSAVVAADGADFTITVNHTAPKSGEEITVVIHGDQLEKLFGFEINITYSPEKLEFIDAKSLLGDGFSVPPIVHDGAITYAFTKVGASTAGVSGKADLASLKFKAIETGETEIKLTRIKSVAKHMAASETALDESVHVLVSVEKADITFKDVPEGFWAQEAISRAASLGIVKGYPDGTFKPQKYVTRAEFVTMLIRALEFPIDAQPVSPFKDDELIGAWAKPYVASAAASGIVVGYPDETFRPNDLLTRAEMVVIVARALELPTNSAGQLRFADAENTPAWASPSVAAAYDAGIIKGVGNNRFAPEMSTNRAEAVTVIMGMMDYLQENR